MATWVAAVLALVAGCGRLGFAPTEDGGREPNDGGRDAALDGLTHRAFIKASNTGGGDGFGTCIGLSADGVTLAVGAVGENSAATGVGGNQADGSASFSGAAYVFTRTTDTWSQQAYLKASNTETNDFFGDCVAISADGSTLAVGAFSEDSAAVGIGGNQADNTALSSGAVYVFTRAGTTWTQQAYVKPSNSRIGQFFGSSIALAADGSTLAVAGHGEDSAATGIGGNQTSIAAPNAGAVYVFTRAGTTWSQQAYVKASNTDPDDSFGQSIALSDDGSTLAVGAFDEDSAAVGIGGDQADDTALGAGAAYLFTRTGVTWTQQAYIKASNTGAGDRFGWSLDLSSDGSTLGVGAPGEASAASGLDGNQADNSLTSAGGAYLFRRAGATWTQEVYVKASNTGAMDAFGVQIALAADGATLAVGAVGEASTATGIDGDQADSSAEFAGAVYLFTRAGPSWTQRAYIKASNTGDNDRFGSAIALSVDSSTLAVGAEQDDSDATGIDGDQANPFASNSGAVHVYR